VADELDVAGRYRIHGTPLQSCAAPRPSPRRRRDDVEGKAFGLRRFKLYLIEGGQPTEADDQILGAQDGGQGRGTSREGHLAGRIGVT
jgi:hypothetical protein